MSSSETPELILHRWPGRWNLPSLSPECIAVETYLRLAGLRFAAEDCRTHYASPSGALEPEAVPTKAALSGASEAVGLLYLPHHSAHAY